MTVPRRATAPATFAIHLKIAAALGMTLMLACIKGLEGSVPVGQIAFYRSAVTLLPMFAWILWRRSAGEIFSLESLARHLPRGVSGSVAMFLSFMTIACLPLAEAILLGYVTPLMTVVLALVLLGEKVPAYRWTGAILGALGVLIALLPHLAAAEHPAADAAVVGIGAGLLGALFGAVSIVQIRGLTATERPGAIVFYYTLMTGILGAATWLFGWVMPDARQLLLLLGAGVFGGVAQLLVAQSLLHAHVSVTAPFEYTTLLWSVLISYAMFDQAPGATVVAGGLVVAASGILTVWRESRGPR